MSGETSPGPLSGVRVLDLTRLLPGGYATLLLAGLGAQVVKIEEVRGGDGLRVVVPRTAAGESGAHAVLNRGKASLAVDLKQDAGRELLLRLVSASDVLIDSFRPGVLDRLGLGPDALSAANPRLVHVSIDAYGSDGPYRTWPAHDLNTLGYAGVLSLSVGSDGKPTMPPIQIADLSSGLQATLAVLSGLRVAERDGTSFRADVSMADSAASLLTLAAASAAATGLVPAVPDALTGALACYGVYQCADTKWITVAGLEPKFFARMVELMGRGDLAGLQYDLPAQRRLHTELTREFASQAREHWLNLLAAQDTCVGPVNNVAEALADPNFVSRAVITDVRLSNGSRIPGIRAVPWIAEPELAAAPALSADAGRLLAELGVPDAQIAQLRAGKVIG